MNAVALRLARLAAKLSPNMAALLLASAARRTRAVVGNAKTEIALASRGLTDAAWCGPNKTIGYTALYLNVDGLRVARLLGA